MIIKSYTDSECVVLCIFCTITYRLISNFILECSLDHGNGAHDYIIMRPGDNIIPGDLIASNWLYPLTKWQENLKKEIIEIEYKYITIGKEFPKILQILQERIKRWDTSEN